MEKIDLNNQKKKVLELDFLANDSKLTTLVRELVDSRLEKKEELIRTKFKPNAKARAFVEDKSLEKLLKDKVQINNFTNHREITNIIAFNISTAEDPVHDKQMLVKRKELDEYFHSNVLKHFTHNEEYSVFNSGNFWYPPGGFMGWHTNETAESWRLYINYCTEPGKSFFKYRDSDTGEITTLVDKEWNFRLFHATQKNPLWHCVYSDTNRFSFGYMIMSKDRVKKRYEGMYNAGYENQKYEDCYHAHQWLEKNYPEQYATSYHRIRAKSTQNKLAWLAVRKLAEGKVAHRFKNMVGGRAK